MSPSHPAGPKTKVSLPAPFSSSLLPQVGSPQSPCRSGLLPKAGICPERHQFSQSFTCLLLPGEDLFLLPLPSSPFQIEIHALLSFCDSQN